MNIVDMTKNHALENAKFKNNCTLITASMHFFLELDFMPYLRAEMRLIEKLFRFEDECDLGDGWEDQAVHKDSDETREKALRMGANIIEYIFQ